MFTSLNLLSDAPLSNGPLPDGALSDGPLRGSANGITLDYLHSPTPHQAFVIELVILDSQSHLATFTLNSDRVNLRLVLELDLLDARLATQITKRLSQALPSQSQHTLTDPSLLHLVNLLQTEQQAPQCMNQLLVSSIATILTLHLVTCYQNQGLG